MKFELRDLTLEDVKEISTWKYGGEYSIYDEDSYEEKLRKHSSLVDPVKMKRYTCFYLNGELIGFINLLEEEESVFFGIALNPKYCGQGYGPLITKKAIELSKSRYPAKPLRLEVRSWNTRAVRCYEKAGFKKVGEKDLVTALGPGHFTVMEA